MSRVYLELGPKKVFACSLGWPGWCRIGKSSHEALDTLQTYVPRYRIVAERAGLAFDPGDPVVVEEVPGNGATDFGVPQAIPEADLSPITVEDVKREVALVRAAWELFAEVAASSPEELRKGPRGGGRDRDKMIAHVVEAERAYARSIGIRHKPFAFDDEQALTALREEIAKVLSRPSDGTPVAGKGWPARYATRRIAWHVIDHLWEMEDRRT